MRGACNFGFFGVGVPDGLYGDIASRTPAGCLVVLNFSSCRTLTVSTWHGVTDNCCYVPAAGGWNWPTPAAARGARRDGIWGGYEPVGSMEIPYLELP